MELLLNLVWLLLSLGLFARLSVDLRRERQCGRTGHAPVWVRSLSAVVLAFILLPVISMTDDLHAMPAMAEGERAVRAQAADTAQQQQHNLRVAVVFLAALPMFQSPLCPLGRVEKNTLPLPASPWTSPQTANRAPPSLLA